MSFERVIECASFNSQPPEGGWLPRLLHPDAGGVSTHSRPKAAGSRKSMFRAATGRFNSQPPEGGWCVLGWRLKPIICFNSQPPEGGWVQPVPRYSRLPKFQLTAARRRLAATGCNAAADGWVSTHSRPKAAGHKQRGVQIAAHSFNSQPPEGGWGTRCHGVQGGIRKVSTHSRPKAAG